MKKLMLVMFFATVCTTMYAQNKQGDSEVGITAGGSFSNLSGEGADNTDYLTSVNAGILFRYFLATNIALQTQLLYSGHGAKDGDAKLNMSSLFLPVLARYYLTSLSLFAGPQINYLLSSKYKLNGQTQDLMEFHKKLQLAMVVGASYMFTRNLGLDARYNYGLGDIHKTTGLNGAVRNSIIMLSLVYVLSAKK